MARLARHIFYTMRSEGAGAVREAIAIGLGTFIGCLPLFGLHLALCIAIGWACGLNRLKMYLAANISNPFVAPVLVLSEIQFGSFLRSGTLRSISFDTVRAFDHRALGADLAIGSVAVGALLGTAGGVVTYLSTRNSGGNPAFLDLVRRASDRYATVSITAWEFARAKLRSDPLYRTVVCGGLLPGGERLLDVGCGCGLMLAALAEARACVRTGTGAPGLGTPALYELMTGIDVRPRVVRIARKALGDAAEILEADGRMLLPSHYDAVLICDVLHMMDYDEQEKVLEAARTWLRSGGVLIVREADAASGWRFRAAAVGNTMKALMLGQWKQAFYFRTRREWAELFRKHGLAATIVANGEGTPFASVLFRLTVPIESAKDQIPVDAA
jgi:uncharacterized protein (DUF2062 family)/SAM-dependent methyltransferase